MCPIQVSKVVERVSMTKWHTMSSGHYLDQSSSQGTRITTTAEFMLFMDVRTITNRLGFLFSFTQKRKLISF